MTQQNAKKQSKEIDRDMSFTATFNDDIKEMVDEALDYPEVGAPVQHRWCGDSPLKYLVAFSNRYPGAEVSAVFGEGGGAMISVVQNDGGYPTTREVSAAAHDFLYEESFDYDGVLDIVWDQSNLPNLEDVIDEIVSFIVFGIDQN